jgi:hypothetical protein
MSFQHIEVVTRDEGPGNWVRAIATQRCSDERCVCHEIRKDTVTIPILSIFGIRSPARIAIDVPVDWPTVTVETQEDADKLFCSWHWQWPKSSRVQDREDAHVYPDAKCERKDRHTRKARVFGQLAKSVTKVVKHRG